MDFSSGAILGPTAAFSASITWAVGVLAYSKLSERHPAYVINFTRLLVGLPFLILMLVISSDPLGTIRATTLNNLSWAFAAVMASYAFGDSLFLMASKYIGGPGALAISSIYPMWSALGGVLFKGEELSAARIIGILVIISGTIAVILAGHKKTEIAGADFQVQDPVRKRFWKKSAVIGPILAIGCSLCWALNSLAVSRMGAGLDSSYVNLLRFSMGIFLCPLVGIGFHGTKSFKMIPKKEFVPALPAFLIECIGGPFFYVYGLSHSPLAVGAALSSLAPVISVPLALMLGREKFSMMKTAGVMAVIAGCWILL